MKNKLYYYYVVARYCLFSKKEARDIHMFFELSYANYLVLPRSVLQSMPNKWQVDFVKLLDELDNTYNWRRNGCVVRYKDTKGRYTVDELNNYDRGRRILTPEQVDKIVERHNKK